jgi:hypothetical protein
MFRVVKHLKGFLCFLESQTDSCEEATAQTAAMEPTAHATEEGPRDSCSVQEVKVTGKEHHSSVHVAETEPPASSLVDATHVAETELPGSIMVKPAHVADKESAGSGTAKAAHVTETEPRGIVKPAHVAETEEEIHIKLSIPNRGRLVDRNTSQNNKVNPPVTSNTDQQKARSDSASILKDEEEEEDESRTLRLRTKETERPEEEDEDTDSEDTLGLLQQSKDLLTRHSMANIRMNHQDADVNYLSVPVNNELPLLIICLCLLILTISLSFCC